VRWWRRLSSLEPLSGRIAAELMRALAHAGESALAIAHGREHARLVERELGHAPGPEVTELVRRLNGATDAPAPQPTVSPRANRPESGYAAWLRERLRPRLHLEHVIRETPLFTLFAATDATNGHPLVVRMLAPSIVARADVRRLVDRLYAATCLTHARLAPLGQVYLDEGLVYLAGPATGGETLRS